MADNITILDSTGATKTVRTKDTGVAHEQILRVKLLDAADALLPTLPVAIVSNAAGSTTDTEDGSIASGQATVALVVNMPYIYNNVAWVRGGFTPYMLLSAASTNGTSLKASAGVLGMCLVTNRNAAVRYLKFYNKASAPTVGTDTPVQVYEIPGSTTGAGIALPLPDRGLTFTTGIAFATTTGFAVADTGAVAANEIIINLGWL